MIIDNLINVTNDINNAIKASKYQQEVTLVAVSKMHSVEEIKEAYDAGIRDFGENKVQEMISKIDLLPKDIRWHLIGHLQTNKVKYIIGKTHLIHSVDSFRLAEEINKQSEKANLITGILVQINISGEETKFGIDKEETVILINQISKLKNVAIQGLMTIAPNEEDPENTRAVFRQLRNLSIDIKELNIDNVNMNVLSMGMSGDFMVAIDEGSNLVRVGTRIFGARNYLNK